MLFNPPCPDPGTQEKLNKGLLKERSTCKQCQVQVSFQLSTLLEGNQDIKQLGLKLSMSDLKDYYTSTTIIRGGSLDTIKVRKKSPQY
jgi:uncharacterized protein (DUF983 family)